MTTIQFALDASCFSEFLISGNLICIAGRLSAGKTTLLQQIQQMGEASAKGSTVLISPENPHNDFDNAPYISAETIRQHLLEIQGQREIKLVLIDNLGLLDDVEGDKGEGLQRMAVDLNLTVVVTYRLQSMAEIREDGEPKFGDFSEVIQAIYPDVMVLLFDGSDMQKAYVIRLSQKADVELELIQEVFLVSY